MNTEPKIENNLKEKVLGQIESEAICPKSRLLFTSREITVWFFWFLTIFLGSLAVAASSFILQHQFYALYEITHGSFWSIFLETLPLLWLIVFVLMVFFAVYNLRHTKKGYRYQLWQILGSSLVLSLVGGSLLHLIGVGFMIDKNMGTMTKYYESQTKREARIWQQPEQGRLLGQLAKADIDPWSTKVNFIDNNLTIWKTDISELEDGEIHLLTKGVPVRLFGEVVDRQVNQFHACAVLPWFSDMPPTRSELQNLKARMKEKVARYNVDSLCAEKLILFRPQPTLR